MARVAQAESTCMLRAAAHFELHRTLAIHVAVRLARPSAGRNASSVVERQAAVGATPRQQTVGDSDGSVTDRVAVLNTETTADEIGRLPGCSYSSTDYYGYNDARIVSDILGDLYPRWRVSA